MTPKTQWNRVQALCEQAEKLPVEERLAFLARVESSPEIRAEAAAMLEALADEAEAQALAPPTEPERTPSTIGPYTITEYLGRGGTGTVYAAEIDRAGVKQQLAVKVLHAHLSDGDTEARFRREQQMLAQLDHPGITRVIDAGITGDQQPYLVMDRVDGEPIDVYCDRMKLDLRARIALMLQVCDAVQSAHRNLIVHLDLKPSNLLVTKDGRAKLLDFGTAKLVRPGDLTTTRQLTPLYASPEQLRGEGVTTACDVYSLGVVSYELFAGDWPFGSRESMLAIWERAAGNTENRPMADHLTAEVAERRGMRMEQLRAALQGDLQVIISKALAMEPGRRYKSVAAFAEDLQRYLDQRPVLAKPQTTAYRVTKYAARHKGALSLTGVLLVGLAAVALYAWQQQREKLRAAQVAQETASFLNWMISSSRPMYGGREDMTVKELVRSSSARVNDTEMLSPATKSLLLSALGSYLAGGGDPEHGNKMIREALSLARQANNSRTIMTTLDTLALNALDRGNCAEALGHSAEADQLFGRAAEGPVDRATHFTNKYAVLRACQPQGGTHLELTEAATKAAEEIPDNSSETPLRARLYKALVLNGHAMALASARRGPEAKAVLNRAFAYAGTGTDSPGVRIALLRTLSGLEYGEKNVPASAKALEEAVQLSPGYTDTFEFLRLKVMWARRLAEIGDHDKARHIARDTIAETKQRAEEVGAKRWMIFVDSAQALQASHNCAGVPELMGEVDALAGTNIGTSWRGNRLTAEGLCLVRLGKKAEGQKVVKEALTLLAPLFSPGSKLKKELEEASQ